MPHNRWHQCDSTPLIQAVPGLPIGPGTLLIFVNDEQGETAYAIPDPRASN
jgi:hypothetical protein